MNKRVSLLQIGLLVLIVLSTSTAYASPIPQDIDEGEVFVTRSTAEQSMLSPWLFSQDVGGTVYFAFGSGVVQRFDLPGETWLPVITLLDKPDVITIDSSGIYLVAQKQLYRYALDGTNRQQLGSPFPTDVYEIISGDLYLYVSFCHYSSCYVRAFHKTTGMSGGEITANLRLRGMSVTRNYSRLVAQDLAENRLISYPLNSDGSILQYKYPVVHKYPNPATAHAGKTIFFPGETRVADDWGNVYNTLGLSVHNHLVDSFEDLVFYKEQVVAAHHGVLVGYSRELRPLGKFSPAVPPEKLSIYADALYYFYNSPDGIATFKMPLSRLNLSTNPAPVDPALALYGIDQAVLGNDQSVILLSKKDRIVFRWSIPQRQYVNSIPLSAEPQQMAYAAETDRLYLGYSSGEYPNNKITQIHLVEPFAEEPFASPFGPIVGLVRADEFLVAISGYEVSQYTLSVYDSAGTLISKLNLEEKSIRGITWYQANRRIYFIASSTGGSHPGIGLLHSFSLNAAGFISDLKATDFKGNIEPPIRISPDGSVIVLGSGHIFNATALNLLGQLSNTFLDAVPIGNKWYTLQAGLSGSQIEVWNSTYLWENGKPIPAGSPEYLFEIPEGLLAITSVGGLPQFSILDANLSEKLMASGSMLFLPGIHTPTRDYLDNFENPTSGWPVLRGDGYSFGYERGEYYLGSENSDGYGYFLRAPTCALRNFILDVDMRWGDSQGYGYGVVFDIVGPFDRFHVLEIIPIERAYAVIEVNGDEVRVISVVRPSQYFGAGAVNHLTVDHTDPNGIAISINGFQYGKLITGEDVNPYVGGVGVYASENLGGDPGMNARFDNFTLSRVSGGMICPTNILEAQHLGNDPFQVLFASFLRKPILPTN